MTQRAGSYITGGGGEVLPSSAKQGGRVGSLRTFVGSTTIEQQFKNEGWYAAGSVWETWFTNVAPNATPPSGHTLTFVQFVLR